MELEKIVLIFALFGSAKVVFDTIIDAVKVATNHGKKADKTVGGRSLEDVVGVLETMTLANESLRDCNVKLQKRIDDLEASVVMLQAKPAGKRSTRSIKGAPEKPESAQNVDSHLVIPKEPQGKSEKPHAETPFYMDTDRFEVVIC